MGHRANFVLIRDGSAVAYHDQWAALGSTYAFAGGPDDAASIIGTAEPTSELLDWAFAEAGFLIDFDENRAIVFGYPEPLELDGDDMEGIGADLQSDAAGLDAAINRGPLEFLQFVAPRWRGWLLEWDERGVDAFAAHLARRGIDSIATQPPSHPADATVASFQA
jgi:hypothetical protein